MPSEVDRLTLTEIALLLDDDTERPRPPTGSEEIDPWSVQERIERRRAMTLPERIEESRRA